MSIKDISKTVAVSGGVAIASAGLTTCDFGAVDPAPPPVDCKAIGGGQQLKASGTYDGNSVVVSITGTTFDVIWKTAQVTGFTGASAANVQVTGTNQSLSVPVVVTLTINAGDGGTPQDGGTGDGGVPMIAGTFDFAATVADYRGTTCDIKRTFSFQVQQGAVLLAQRDALLPLGARQEAVIAVLERDGAELLLEARTPYLGSRRVDWTVTGGATRAEAGERLGWRLPPEPGLYQVELVVDYGDDGLSFDTLAFEVT
jgi:hypothetical protein